MPKDRSQVGVQGPEASEMTSLTLRASPVLWDCCHSLLGHVQDLFFFHTFYKRRPRGRAQGERRERQPEDLMISNNASYKRMDAPSTTPQH